MILLKFCKDWADEFDVYGFRLLTVDEYDAINERMNSEEGHNTYFRFHFGTNEGWGGDESWYEVWNDSFLASAIPAEDAKVIIDTFGKYWGHFPDFF